MDEKTTAPRPAAPHRQPARRRALAAAALLLSVTAAVSACGSSSGAKHDTAGASSSASSSASPSGSASTGATSGAPSAPGSTDPSAPGGSASAGAGSGSGSGGTGAGGSAPTPAPQGNNTPGAPAQPTPGNGGVTPEPVDPIHPTAAFKPLSYLAKGNQLTVFFDGGICDKYGLKISEDKPGVVGVDVIITQRQPTGQMCPALARQQSVVGTMAQPLNGRSVVSLRDGSAVPLESAPNGGPVSAGN
ncbi:hypothetical protein [Kitasatospora viridis]|uniref:Uncharacterized protein n=1 Tax=Kitasatospora viridis TaxID=281105 RepID=A0A561UM26_9ACTN|nr:hypothetical protein [Kitasatospora viridis]TWG00394.1 hypothetical protein FHX73_114269 [Kitasatospora viridis]